MKVVPLTIALSIAVLSIGLGSYLWAHNAPPFYSKQPMPTPRGWINERRNDTTQLGEFVLGPGESVSNGEVVITVLEVFGPPNPPLEAADSDGSAARFQFSRAGTGELLCQATLEESSTSYDTSSFGGVKPPFDLIDVEAVEANDGWVSFTICNLDSISGAPRK